METDCIGDQQSGIGCSTMGKPSSWFLQKSCIYTETIQQISTLKVRKSLALLEARFPLHRTVFVLHCVSLISRPRGSSHLFVLSSDLLRIQYISQNSVPSITLCIKPSLHPLTTSGRVSSSPSRIRRLRGLAVDTAHHINPQYIVILIVK